MSKLTRKQAQELVILAARNWVQSMEAVDTSPASPELAQDYASTIIRLKEAIELLTKEEADRG